MKTMQNYVHKGIQAMRALTLLTKMELKLLFRIPEALVFSLVLPLLTLIIFGYIFGNHPNTLYDGYGSVDISLPGYIAMIIGTTTLIILPIEIITYRERGICRRYSIMTINPIILLVSQILVHFIMIIISTFLLIAVAYFFFNLTLPANLWTLLPGYFLCCASFLILGVMLAHILSSTQVAHPICNTLFLPMLFFSGACIPHQIMPETMRNVSTFLPLSHITILLKDLWLTASWNTVSLIVLICIFIISFITLIKTFRWI